VNIKVKVSLAESLLSCPKTEETVAFAKDLVSKESNEQILGFVLSLINDDEKLMSAFKTAKPSVKAVYISQLPENLVEKGEIGKQIFELISKEACPSSPDSIKYVSYGLEKLSHQTGFPWEKFIQEADSKSTGVLRAILSYPESCQLAIIHWLASPNTSLQNEAITRCVASIALGGSGACKKALFTVLAKNSVNILSVPCLSGLIDSNYDSWKLLKASIKEEQDFVSLFDVCMQLNHDWVVLGLSKFPATKIAAIIHDNVDRLFKPMKLTFRGAQILEAYEPAKSNKITEDYISELLKEIASSSSDENVKIWQHKDAKTPAFPISIPSPAQKRPDPKAEKLLIQEQVAHENAIRGAIEETIKKLANLPSLVKAINVEATAFAFFPHLSSEIYGELIVDVLYAMGRSWRPHFVTLWIKSKGLTGLERRVPLDWQASDLASLKLPILRLFADDHRMSAEGLVYCVPALSMLLKEGQMEILEPLSWHLDHLKDFNVAQCREMLTEALLSGSIPGSSKAAERILDSIGGSIEDGRLYGIFEEALLSESEDRRILALRALHSAGWKLTAKGKEACHRICLLADLLEFDMACMEVATTVMAKIQEDLGEGRETMDDAQTIEELAKILCNSSAESWIIPCAEELLGRMSPSQVIPLLMAKYDELWRARRPEIVNVRSKDMDLTRANRRIVIEAFGTQSLAEATPAFVGAAFEFLLGKPFYDGAEEINETALQSATSLMESIPEERMETIGPLLGERLEGFIAVSANDKSHSAEENDRVRVFAIILLGKISRYIGQDAGKLNNLVRTMMETLKTPSESVQGAIGDALVSLFSGPRSREAASWAGQLKTMLLDPAGSMASRRGAAYGLGALAKARGLMAVKEWGLLELLLGPFAAEGRKGSNPPEAKQGALFGMELLACNLGFAFEPYVLRTIDAVLAGFADGKAEVREATLETAKALMGCISSAGSRVLLPELLSRVTREDANWRAKVGVIEWLGAIAGISAGILVPRLPQIIPVLIDAGLNDSHGQVQLAARHALTRYGHIVANPEMRSLMPSILEALASPAQLTQACFKRILECPFAHLIDGPSLALLEPLLRRALLDRSAGGASIKKLAGQIIGNLATSLVDAADFGPYLCRLVPALCSCLGDPVPQVRAHAAKVLGMLVQVAETDGRQTSLAAVETLFPDLQTRLVGMAESASAPSDGIDRAGAAQAIAEIMAAKGTAFCGSVLHSLIAPWLSSEEAYYWRRESGLMILGYLPGAFIFYGRLAGLYHDTVMPALVRQVFELVADDAEPVREVATKTARALVEAFSATDKLGIFDGLLAGCMSRKWRTRLACIGLLEEILTQSGEADASDDADEDNEEESMLKAIVHIPNAEELEASGALDRARIHALQTCLYLARFDPASGHIRTIGLNLWKALSYHSPRTLTALLPLIVQETSKPHTGDAQREAQLQAALEDLFVKLGDRLALPFLRASMELWNANGGDKAAILRNMATLTKVIASAESNMLTKLGMEEALRTLVEAVSLGLGGDNEDGVQDLAASLFDCLVADLLPSQPEQVKSVIQTVLASATASGADNGPLLMLVRCRPVEILAVVIPSILSSLPASLAAAAVPSGPLPLLGALFEEAGHRAIQHPIPTIQALLRRYAGSIDSADEGYDEASLLVLQDCLRQILAVLNDHPYADDDSDADSGDDDNALADSVYHIRLGNIMEAQFDAGPRGRAWAFALIRLYCEASPGVSHARLYPVWVPRLLHAALTSSVPSASSTLHQASASVDAEQAKSALLKLVPAKPKMSQLSALCQLVRAALQKIQSSSLSAWHAPLLTHLVKAIVLPALPLSNSSEAELCKSHACDIVISLLALTGKASAGTASWGSSSLTLLVGALIRQASDRHASEAVKAQCHAALLAAMRAHPAALKPFFPQLQRLASQTILSGQEAASSKHLLTLLLPLMPKPESLVQEWAAILAVSDANDTHEEFEGDDESTTSIQKVSPQVKTALLETLSALFAAPSAATILCPKLEALQGPLVLLIKDLAAHPDEAVRLANATLIEAMAKAAFITPAQHKELASLSSMLK
jgi:hypothetical protein